MYELIDKYIEKLITQSTPDKPLWNIETILAGKEPHWNYIDGCMVNSVLELYRHTNDKKYLDFLTNFIDYYVFEDGTIRGYDILTYNVDDICESRILFDLYDITGNEKYRKAIEFTYGHIKTQPRTSTNNFWHKKIYPNQVWLDGLYMAQPFYIRYETVYNNLENYGDIVNQFENVRKIMFDEKAKLYYHGYDDTKSIFWADKQTGLSKNFWLRSIGWYTVALADCCGYMDEQMYDEYRYLGGLLKEVIDGILQYQDKESKMFYQVPNFPNKENNYLETSGSVMIAYAILKGVRLGILPSSYQQIGVDIFNGICDRYLTEKDGDLNLGGICLVAGLGPENNTRRDGSYEYYMSEPIVENDAKGVGPFIMAYTEILKINSK